MNPTTKSKEILQWTPEEVITLRSIDDLKKQLNIDSLPDEYKKYFEKPLETTKSELIELRKKYLEEKPNNNVIKWFLEKTKETIYNKSKKSREELKKVTWEIKKSTEIEAKKNLEWKIDSKKAEQFIDTILEKSDEKIKNIENSENIKKGKEKIKETVKKTKDITKKWIDTLEKSKWISNLINSLEKLKEKWWLGWFFATLLLFIFWIFWFNKKIEQKEKVEKLTEEQIKQTKKYVGDLLIKQFPDKKEYIEKTINNPKIFTEEKLQYFYKKIKAWEKISLKDLSGEFKDLNIEKILKEKTEKLKQELYNKIINEIEEKYNKHLSPEQKEKVIKLSNKYLWINPDSIENIENRIFWDKQLQIKDITPILWEVWGNVLGFMLWLISENIISITDIGMTFVNAWMDVIKISLSTLWLNEIIKIDDFYKNLDKLNEEQKAILLALLYRKWGIFLSILWNLSATTSKIVLETILPTNSWVDWIKLVKDSLIHWNLKQVENFEKIEKALSWTKVETNGSKILKEALINLKEVKRNFILLDFLEKSHWDTNKFYSLLENFEKTNWINFNLEKFNNFEELQKWLAKKVKIDFATNFEKTFRWAKNKYIWFGVESAIQEFNKNLEKITEAQARIALWKFNLNVFKKLSESINIWKVSKLWDSLLFELRSPEDGKAFFKQLNELAKKSPELLKWIFNKLPIIAIAGLSLNSQEWFFKSIENEMKYLFSFLWPALILWEWWVDWSSFPPKIISPEKTAIAWALFTMDWYFFLKEKWAINKFKYLIKPISDIYDIWKWTVNTWQKLYKTLKILWPRQAVTESWEIITKTLKRVKNIKWPAFVKALWLFTIWIITTTEFAFADDNENIFKDYTKENWELDVDKLMKEKDKLTSEQKEEIIKLVINGILNEEPNLNIKVENNKLIIISKDPKIKSDWFLTEDTKEYLNKILGINDFDFKYEQTT